MSFMDTRAIARRLASRLEREGLIDKTDRQDLYPGLHTGSHLVSRFNEWKQTHTKSYATGQAEAAALAAFSHNDALIEEHNQCL